MTARFRMALAALAAIASVGTLAIVPVAQAYTKHNYCNILLQPHQSCGSPETTSMTGNIARYGGEGVVSVCQWVFEGGGAISHTCGNNGTGGTNIVESHHGLKQGFVENNMNEHAHTIIGEWFSL